MKKIIFLGMAFCMLLLTGCGKYTVDDVVKDMSKKIDKANTYHLKGDLEIINNEESYKYDVEVSFKKEDNYRVSLTNKSNDHNQIILKNKDGVYVLTPSLNKTFKFESQWPEGSSQIYLLQSIVEDLANDKDKEMTKEKDGYMLTSKVSFPNNDDLVKQVVTVDKDLNVKKVEVLGSDNNPKMTMNFKDIDYKASFKNDYFDLDTNNVGETKETVSSIDDTIYPMYLPEDTKLTNQETIEKVNGERVIMTFGGNSPFILVEETVDVTNDLDIVPTFGEPILLGASVGSISENSVTWTNGSIDYYLSSEVLKQDELLKIAQSVGTIPVMK